MASSDVILAGDIGGTNARFGCLERKASGSWTVHHFSKMKGADFVSFDEALQKYLSTHDLKPKRAAFSAAGPVEQGYINLTNADWQISAQRVQDNHGVEICALYNDFTGMTRAIPELSDDDFITVRSGQARPNETILVAGPGTGFGVGYLVPTKQGWHVMPTEGGHMAFTPQTKLELELLTVLQKDMDFVSLELVSSGKGLPVIHKAICDIHGQPYTPLSPDDIREKAVENDPICEDVCRIRSAATMGAIGDLTLAGGARGGVVLAGGVSERMLDFYMRPEAMNRFLNRGVRTDYVRDIPMRLLKCPMAPLIGSAALLEDQT